MVSAPLKRDHALSGILRIVCAALILRRYEKMMKLSFLVIV